ncbi:MAG: phospholipid/cholesterol/gamma-HCH transport system substrate-binding protein [Solirubrobacteraceae bacterium]|jgi:phospholipid/cholesterol/gamma-HCH transport system substrate-binding protein|nr:phospholipid/cholesterol/gamma-HCH transport system substrate-binding protein [Solirubrobacteraceae bacterium]
MSGRAFAAVGGLAAVVLIAVLALGGGSDQYHLKLQLRNAGGLRQGAEVAVGGVHAGKADLSLDSHGRVIADLAIDPKFAPVGKDVRASISAVNLLGQKRIVLEAGDADSNPAPSGYSVSPGQVHTSTDLDQVLDVLAPDTRARLAILLNEGGIAFGNRREDVRQILSVLPPSLDDATQLVNQVASDNHTLGELVQSSDGIISELTRRRAALTNMVDVAGQATTTLAERQAALRATLARAPGALSTLQRFLGELRTTTVPLGPAARNLTATAPQLSAVLDQIDPTRRAAAPALATAIDVAPDLTHLARAATPVLRKANPTVASLARTGTALEPVSHTLDRSADNIIAILDNWSRAIQFRDGPSHVFRGQASVTPETLRSIIDRELAGGQQTAKRNAPTKHRRHPGATDALPAASPAPSQASLPLLPGLKLPELPDAKPLLESILHPQAGQTPSDQVKPLLDYLLKP